MELKLIQMIADEYSIWCSNRTFMELKLARAGPAAKAARPVLIVPLWN